MSAPAVQIGEGFAGDGPHAAHVNTVLGRRDGPVGAAWATALATPSPGHTPFVVVLAPNLPVTPPTLFISKATVTDESHARVTWGAAQAGVAAGVAEVLTDRIELRERAGELVLIAAVWVDPAATDEELVYANNRLATAQALRQGAAGGVPVEVVIERAASGDPANPFFRRA